MSNLEHRDGQRIPEEIRQKVRDAVRWAYEHDWMILPGVTVSLRGQDKCCCPMGAVALHAQARGEYEGFVLGLDDAAEVLGVSKDDVGNFAAAFDSYCARRDTDDPWYNFGAFIRAGVDQLPLLGGL